MSMSNPGPAWVLLDRQVVANVASVNMVKGFSAAFDNFVLLASGFVALVTGGQIWGDVSEDGGATWKTAVTDYTDGGWSQLDNSALQVEGRSAGTKGPHMQLSGSTGNAGIVPGSPTAWKLEFARPWAAGENKIFRSTGESWFPTGTHISRFSVTGIYLGTTNAINGLRFSNSSGANLSGTFALYGVRYG